MTAYIFIPVSQPQLPNSKKLRDRRGLTMLFITHNMDVVAYLADQVAVMYQGRIVETGPVDQVCHAPTHSYTQTLLAAVPRF